MDVLGFDGILRDLGLHALHAKYQTLIDDVKTRAGSGIDIARVGGFVAVGWLDIDCVYFSDTVLFWTRYNPVSLRTFTELMAGAVCFSIEAKLPLRGAITVGDAILDKSSGTFLGEALVEAARTEREQKWIGLSFGPSFQRPPRNQGFDLTTVLPYKSHYKTTASSLATGMVVDWPRKWRESRGADVRPLIRTLDKAPAYGDYYAHTLAFVDFSETNHDWFKRQPHLSHG